MKNNKLIIAGGGEHTRVVAEAVRSNGQLFDLLGFVDPERRPDTAAALKIPQLGDDDVVSNYPHASGVLGIGGIRLRTTRRRIVTRLTPLLRGWLAVVHRDASIYGHAQISDGSVIMAKAVLNSGCRVGRHCIINTGTIVEHDTIVGDFSQLGPGVIIGGGATIGRNAFLGLGCSVRDHISIGENAVIGMGSVVVDDVPEGACVMGVPARQQEG